MGHDAFVGLATRLQVDSDDFERCQAVPTGMERHAAPNGALDLGGGDDCSFFEVCVKWN
jgi:hypothetical protein